MPTEFLTATVLATLGGQVVGIALLVQLLRAIPLFDSERMETALAVICGVGAQVIFAWHGLTGQGLVLNLLNGVLVGLTVLKGTDMIARRVTITREAAQRLGIL